MPRFLVSDPFDNLATVSRLDRPLLIVHGARDGLIPHAHAERLHAAAPRSRLVTYPNADHNDCPPDWEVFWRQVREFLGEAGLLSAE